jgi:hypothetical protein
MDSGYDFRRRKDGVGAYLGPQTTKTNLNYENCIRHRSCRI